ncbi:MAG: DUF1499 domain-containing protein [Thermodesulfobacteriota bacterium]
MKILLLLAPLAALALCGCAAAKPAPQMANGELAPCPGSPNCVSSLAKESSRYIAPIAFNTDPKSAMERLAKVIAAMPNAKIEKQGPELIEASFKSKVFGFVDDLTARMDAANNRIEVRSAARSGYYDFGVNRSRLEKIRKAFAEGANP